MHRITGQRHQIMYNKGKESQSENYALKCSYTFTLKQPEQWPNHLHRDNTTIFEKHISEPSLNQVKNTK
jgi:hypothetical protein